MADLTALAPCPILGTMDADRIKTIRHYYGLSQERFAFLLGVSRNSIIRWESGVAPPHSLSVRRQLMRLESRATSASLAAPGEHRA